jgi:hypothetical protein
MSTNLLADANRKFRAGEYKEALELYELAAERHKELSRAIAVNKEICLKRLGHLEKETRCGKDIFYLLTNAPIIKYEIPYQSYLRVANDIRKGRSNEATALRLLECLSCNPFQKSILVAAARTLTALGHSDLVIQASKAGNLNLAKLIRLATEPSYWLLNRHGILATLPADLINNSSLEYLIGSAPLEKYEVKHAELLRKNNLDNAANGAQSFRSPKPSITIGTILLNEQKFIPENLCQHYELCDEWIIVEGACQGYPARKVSDVGLSLDKTEELIKLFPDPKNKIKYIQYGWTKSKGEDAKSELRNIYLKFAKSEILVVVDADEFYIKEHFDQAIVHFESQAVTSVVLPQVHFWKDTSQFITGEYYDVSHTRFFRNIKGMKYINNHNFPELNNKFIHELGKIKLSREISESSPKSGQYEVRGPVCFHLGFAKDLDDMQDKTTYYINRGESVTRPATTKARAAWFDDNLPEDCKLWKWMGMLPKYIRAEEKIT